MATPRRSAAQSVTGKPTKDAHVNKTAHNVNKSEQAATKTKGLNRRSAAFVAEYLKDRNATQAAIRAGYSPEAARQQGSRLLTKADIRAEIDFHQAEMLEQVKAKTGVSLERVITEVARIAFFDPRLMFKADGEPLGIQDLDDETAAVVAGLDVLEETHGSGQERRVVGSIKKWKLADKKGALDMLMKHLGGYKVDNEQGSSGNVLADFMTNLAERGSRLPTKGGK